MTYILVGAFCLLLLNRHARAESSTMTAVHLQLEAVEAVRSNNYENAIRLYAKALQYLRSSGQQSDAGTVYLNIAQMEQIQGEFSAAEASYKHALKLFEHYTLPNDWRTVSTLDGLGWLYVTVGKRGEASSLLEEARKMAEHSKFDPDEYIRHLDTQAAYLAALGRYSEAQKKWRQALEVGKSEYALDAAQYHYVLLHSGQASALYGDYATAAEMFRRFLEADQRKSVTKSLSHVLAAAELGHVYVRLGKPTEAEPWLDEAVQAFQGKMDHASLIHSIVLSYLGDYYMTRQDWGAAKMQYEQALTIREQILGDNHAAAEVMVALSAALRKLHSKNAAKELDLRAKAILEAEKMPSKEQTVDILALRAR